MFNEELLCYNVVSKNKEYNMKKQIDVTGQKFNMLTALYKTDSDVRGASYWMFMCDCGTEKQIRLSTVKSGRVKACGCMKDRTSHGMSKTHTYKCWTSMKQRCINPNAPDYSNYGGRGILLCEEWFTFEKFFSDIGEIPKDKEIDRVDTNGNYEPNNVKLSSRKEQMQNIRGSKIWVVNGVTYNSHREASKITGISSSQINRMCNGYTHPQNGIKYPPKPNCSCELKYKEVENG